MKEDILLVDVRGSVCPTPVIETKKASDGAPKRVIKTLVDNEVSRDNVVKFGQSQGYLTTVHQEGKDFSITMVPPDLEGAAPLVQTTGENKESMLGAILESSVMSSSNSPDLSSSLTVKQSNLTKRVLLMTKDYLGEGNQDLGRNLMKTFWACLAEADAKPKAIYFINSAVKMVAQDSDHLDNLKQLADDGVEIAACGICLDFYHLKESVAVGSITNLYAITEALVRADLVKL